MDPPNNDSTSKLLSAIDSNNVEEVEMILRQGGVNVNDITVKEGKIVHRAVEHKDTRCLQLLLEHGADPNIKNKDWDAPLHIAADCKNADAVRLLIEHGANVEQSDYCCETALNRASIEGDKPTIRELLKAGAKLEGTALLVNTVRTGDEDFLAEILQHCQDTGVEPNVNEFIRKKTTPLDMAAHKGLKKSMELLMKHGADPNTGDDYFTFSNRSLPIHGAMASGDIECVKMLLPPVTDVELINMCKLSAFFHPMDMDEDKGVEMCKLLIEAGVDVNTLVDIEHSGDYSMLVLVGVMFDYIKVFDGGVFGTALCELTLLEEPRLEIARVLLDAGARIDPIQKNELPVLVAALQTAGDDVSLLQLLAERGPNVNIYHERFVGNLAVICTRGNFTALEFILNAGAEVDSLFEGYNYDDDVEDDDDGDDDDDDDGDDVNISLPEPPSNLGDNSNADNIGDDVDDDDNQDDDATHDDDANDDHDDEELSPPRERVTMLALLSAIYEKGFISKIVLKILEYSVKVDWTDSLQECLDGENKEKILDIIGSPRSLQHLCRAAVRKEISSKHLISQSSLYNLLPLPPVLIDYVLHKPTDS